MKVSEQTGEFIKGFVFILMLALFVMALIGTIMGALCLIAGGARWLLTSNTDLIITSLEILITGLVSAFIAWILYKVID